MPSDQLQPLLVVLGFPTVVLDAASAVFITVGVGFYLAGTLGLLRFGDPLSRLHALTKADNVGLGFLAVGLILRATSLASAGRLVLIWLLALLASSSACYLIGQTLVKNRKPTP